MAFPLNDFFLAALYTSYQTMLSQESLKSSSQSLLSQEFVALSLTWETAVVHVVSLG